MNTGTRDCSTCVIDPNTAESGSMLLLLQNKRPIPAHKGRAHKAQQCYNLDLFFRHRAAAAAPSFTPALNCSTTTCPLPESINSPIPKQIRPASPAAVLPQGKVPTTSSVIVLPRPFPPFVPQTES